MNFHKNVLAFLGVCSAAGFGQLTELQHACKHMSAHVHAQCHRMGVVMLAYHSHMYDCISMLCTMYPVGWWYTYVHMHVHTCVCRW